VPVTDVRLLPDGCFWRRWPSHVDHGWRVFVGLRGMVARRAVVFRDGGDLRLSPRPGKTGNMRALY